LGVKTVAPVFVTPQEVTPQLAA